MSDVRDLRAERPLRYAAGLAVYRLIWGPAVAAAVPFVLIGRLADYCADKLFPRLGGAVQPVWALAHRAALSAGNAVLGYRPND